MWSQHEQGRWSSCRLLSPPLTFPASFQREGAVGLTTAPHDFILLVKVLRTLEVEEKCSQASSYKEKYCAQSTIKTVSEDINWLAHSSDSEKQIRGESRKKHGNLKEIRGSSLQEKWPFTEMSLGVLANIHHQTWTKSAASVNPQSPFRHVVWAVAAAGTPELCWSPTRMSYFSYSRTPRPLEFMNQEKKL